ncbi:MAG: endonuclease NucS domain-containing protein [Nitrosopumilaceae archaeon]
MPRFQFTAEQIENLKNFKHNLSTEKAKAWFTEEEKAELQTSAILNNEKFIHGENLSTATLDELFSLMRWFSANRNLSNLLYRSNIDEFNSKLRNLIHGSDPFPERVNDFFKLKSIGVQTLSQFLIASDTRKYPFVTSQSKEVLAISSEQDQAARIDALELFQIKNTENLLERTLDYLRDYVVFQSIKNLLNLEKYTQVNNLLWFAYDREEEGPEEIVKSYGSISIENDLKNFLADNIFLVEKGLTLIQKEFDTKEVGRIDLLCKDQKGIHVVIELKKGRKSDEVVGQTLRYLGWVEKNLKSKVRGIIIVNEPDDRLQYALSPLKNLIELKFYKVNFEIKEKM